MVTIPRELYLFLMGEDPLDGVWFDELNEDLPADLPGRFWWRGPLRHCAARPTADLGEDGELVAWLDEVRTGTHGDITLHSGTAAIRLGQARDRLILYREARDAAAALVAKLDECAPHVANAASFMYAHGIEYDGPQYGEALEALRAILSRSGD